MAKVLHSSRALFLLLAWICVSPHRRTFATSPACSIDEGDPSGLKQCPWYNASLSNDDRIEALLAAMTVAEKLAVVSGGSCDRLHVKADGFSEAAHGIAWTGRATVFPCSMGMAATWNVSLVNEMGKVVSREALAKHWGDGSNALSFLRPISISCAMCDGDERRRRTARTQC